MAKYNDMDFDFVKEHLNLYRDANDYKLDILLFGIDVAPKYKNRQDRMIFWKFFNTILTEYERIRWKDQRRQKDRELYKIYDAAYINVDSPQYKKFESIVDKSMNSSDYPMTMPKLKVYLEENGFKRSQNSLEHYLAIYRKVHNKDYRLKHTPQYQDFKLAILDALNGETEYIQTREQWIKDLKEIYEIELTIPAFVHYEKKLHRDEDTSNIKIVISNGDSKRREMDKAKDIVYSHLKDSDYKPMNNKEWTDYIKNFNINLTRSGVSDVIKEIEQENPELAPIYRPSLSDSLRDYFTKHPEMLNKEASYIQDKLRSNGIEVSLSRINDIKKEVRGAQTKEEIHKRIVDSIQYIIYKALNEDF